MISNIHPCPNAAAVVQLLSDVQHFCNPMDYNPPGSSVHGISQARILEWVAIFFSRGSSRPKSPTLAGRFFTTEPPGKPCHDTQLNLKENQHNQDLAQEYA